MPKITSVEPQKKNPRRFNIFLDGKFSFGADEDLIVHNRLVVGKEIEKDLLERLIYGAEIGKLMERMYRLFSVRQRSEKEVRDYWRIKNSERRLKDEEVVSDVAIDYLIENLKKKRLLNDEEFAQRWVDARRKGKKKGDIAIRSELFQKGIEREIIDRVLEQSNGEEKQEDLARQAIEKKWRSLEKFPDIEKKRKGVEFLVRRGFSYSLALSIIEKLIKKEYNNS